MAGTTHYSFEVMDPHSNVWKIEIKDNTYVGTDTIDLTGTTGGDGFSINWSGASDGTYQPIISSDFECQLDLSPETLALFDAIVEGPECRFIVLVFKDGTQYASYYLLQDSMSKPDAGNGTDFITLTGTDGFGLLKDIDFTGYDINSLLRYNYVHWLGMISSKLPIAYNTGSIFAFASVWYEDSQTSSVVPDPEAADPLANTFINESAFLEVDQYGEVKAKSFYDILTALLSIQGLQISQWNGLYLIIQPNTYAQASTRAWYYDSAGNYVTTGLITLSQAIPQRMQGGVYTYILPAKEVTTEYEYRQGIFRNNLFPFNVDEGQTYQLGLSTEQSDLNVSGTMSTIITSDTASNGEFLAIYLLAIHCGSYYALRSGNIIIWSLTPGYITIRDTSGVFSTIVGSVETLSSFSIKLPPLPDEGVALTFRWEFMQFESMLIPNVPIVIPGSNTYVYDDIEGTFIARINTGVAMEGTVLYKSHISNEARADIVLDGVQLGDGANKYSAGALFVNNTVPSVVESNAWTIYSEIGGTAYPINSLRCREMLALRRNTVEVYNGTLDGVPDIHKAIDYDGLKYCVTSIGWNCAAGEYTFSAYVMALDRTSLTVDTPMLSQETIGESSSGGSTGSTPTVVPYPLINDILEYRDNAYKPYAAQGAGGKFDVSTTSPAHTDRLNYDGNLYVSNLFARIAANYTGISSSGLTIVNNSYFSYYVLNSGFLRIAAAYPTGNYSIPIKIGGGTNAPLLGNSQEIIIDDKEKTFTVNMDTAMFNGNIYQEKASDPQNIISVIKAAVTDFTDGLAIFTRIIYGRIAGTPTAVFQEIVQAAENWSAGSKAVKWTLQTVVSGATALSQRLHIDKDGYFKIGSATNYTQFSPSGHQQMIGTATVWNDLNIPGLAVTKAGANDPTLKAFGSTTQILTFDGTIMNECFFTVQMPHGYKEGSALEPHIHWCPMTSPASSLGVVWKLDYQWVNYTGVYSSTDTTISATGSTGTVGYTHLITSFGTISGTGKTISSVLVCRLYRVPTDGSDTYTGDAGFLQFDFHYESDTLGSNTEYGK